MHAIMAAAITKAARSLAAPKNKRQAQRRLGLYEALTGSDRGPVARIALAERERLQGFLATGKYGRGMTPGRADEEKHRADRSYREEVRAGAGKPVARLAAAKPSAEPAPPRIASDPAAAHVAASRRFVEAEAAQSANRRAGMQATGDKDKLRGPLGRRAKIDADRDEARAALARAKAELDDLRERVRLASLPPAEEMRAANDRWLADYRRKSDKALRRNPKGVSKMHPILKKDAQMTPPTQRRVRKIVGMKLGEISLVEAGANQHSKLPIMKSADAAPDYQPTHRMQKKEGDMPEAEHYDDAPSKGGLAMFDQDGEVVYLSDDDLEDVADALDAIADMNEDGDEDGTIGKIKKAMSLLPMALSSAHHQASALMDAGEIISKMADDDDDGGFYFDADSGEIDIDSLSPGLRARLEAGDAAFLEVAKNAAIEERTAWIAKAYTLGIDRSDVTGPLLMRMAQGRSTGEDADLVTELLANANNVQKNRDLLAEIGDRGGDVGAAGYAYAMAGEIAKSGGAQTKEQAVAKAFEMNPELYAQYLRERAGG